MIDSRCIAGDAANRFYSASILDAPWLAEALGRYAALRDTRFNDALGPWERRDYEGDPGLFARTVVAAGDGEVLPEGVYATVRDALIRCAGELGVDPTIPERRGWPHAVAGLAPPAAIDARRGNTRRRE
ncbi:MAG: hypothetical protein ACAI38_09670 [Myxococcota bacterium]|nr:hypothetical protein [Myxococcota bacterium]